MTPFTLRRLTHALFTAALFLGASAAGISTLSAQYYWVGGSGEWSDFANHWATTSGGGTFHTEAPGQDDDVYFDANSFSATGQTVSVGDNTAECLNMNWTDVTNFPTFATNGSGALRIYDSVVLAADMTCNLQAVEFYSTGDYTVTSNGTSFGDGSYFRLYGTGTCTLADAVSVGRLQHTTGTFNTNNKDVFCDFNYESSGTNPKTVILGTSTITAQQWRFGGSNLTLDAGSSTIKVSSFYMDQAADGPFEYANVVINNDSGLIEDTGTIASLDVSQTAGGYVRFEAGQQCTVGEIIGEGTRHNPLHFYSSTDGTPAQLAKTSGTLNLDYILLRDMTANGGATFNATNCLDEGGNTGWNISDIEIWDFYWVGNTGDWDDAAHWSSTSGGSADYGDYPSRFDNVIFDANSFSVDNANVAVNAPAKFASLTATGCTNNPNFDAGYGNGLTAYGSITIDDSMEAYIHNCWWNTPNAYTLSLGENASISYPTFGNGEATLLSDLSCGSMSVQDAVLNCGSNTIECSFNVSVYGSNVVFNLEDSEISCLRWQMNSTSFVLNPGTSTVRASGEFKGNGYTYHRVVLEEDVIVYAENTFDTLEFAPGSLAKLPSGLTQTITGGLVATGTPEAPASISATDDGVQCTVSQASGTVDAIFVVLKDCAATGGATFNATQSIDNGNNSGWNITEIIPQDYYWVGGTGNWSDVSHWSSTSGGAADYVYPPGVLDDVFFDENSFDAAGQTVTIDAEAVNMHTLDFSAVTNSPSFVTGGNTLNLYGSLLFSPNMTFSASNSDFYFLSPDAQTIDFVDGDLPGTSAYLYVDGGGEFTLNSPLTCRELNLSSGKFDADGNDVWVDFETAFWGDGTKVLNVENTTYFTRMMGWNTSFGSNLTILGSGGTIQFSSSFTPYNVGQTTDYDLQFGDLECVIGNFSDIATISASIEVQTLTVEPGKTLEFSSFVDLVVEQLVVQGTADDNIILQSVNDDTQPTISQASGTVDGQYLQLQDIAAIGGATFYANNSLNLGNVSGWIFTGQAQTISFDPVDDVMEDVGTVNLMATASSGLEVSFTVVSGPATVDGAVLTITGAGPVTIEANQDGDTNYNPAPSQTITFCSIPLQPVITVDNSGENPVLSSSANVGNQWYLNGTEIDGADAQLYTATEDGLYSVQVDVDGCVSEVSAEVDVIVDGVSEVLTSSFAFFPNPAEQSITLDLPHIIARAEILDLNGRVILTQQNVTTGQQLNVSELPAGAYLLTLKNQNGQPEATLRLLKN